jgi:hypothetical protein
MMTTSSVQKDNRDILFTTRMTSKEARRIDEALRKFNASAGPNSSRITRSTITRMSLELFLAQAEA